MPNSNFSLGGRAAEGPPYCLNLIASASVTFPFQAADPVAVSFYICYGGPAPVTMTATFGPSTTTINVANDFGWHQVVLPAQGPGPLALTLQTPSSVPPGGSIEVSSLVIGADSINLRLWNANQNGPLSRWLTANYALTLANNAYIEAPTAPNLGAGDFTIETWISTSTAGTLFCGINPALLVPNHPDITSLQVSLQPDQTIAFELLAKTARAGVISKPTTILDGNWHHLAVARSQSTLAIYFDGKLAGTGGHGPSPIDLSGTQSLYCCAGMSAGSLGVFLRATLDEMRFWSRALSAQEIDDGQHHQLTDQEPGLIGHFTFDNQDLSDYSPAGLHLTSQGTVQYTTSDLDFEPAGQPYLVTQAQLMQDYMADPSGKFTEISGYRVVIESRDANDNPFPTTLTIWAADSDSTAELVFMSGATATVTASSSWSGPTDVMGEVSFVIDSQNSLVCPVLKVNAAFMASTERLVISPDRHVHAVLASVTGEQLAGTQPLASGKQGGMANTGTASPEQLSAAATAIAHVMSTAVDHSLQPDRPVTRTRSLPEDFELPISPAPRYESLATIVAPYDFISNAISTHFLPLDQQVSRILVAESMPNPHWSFDFDEATGAFNTLSLDQRNGLLQGRRVQHLDAISAFFAGQQTQNTTAQNLLTLSQSVDTVAARQQRWFGEGFLQHVKDAASLVMTTAEAVVTSAAQTVKYLVVTAIDAAGNAWDSVLQSVEDAVDFVGSVIAKIGAGIVDVINWAKALFNFDDIRQSATVIYNVISQIPGVMKTVLSQTESKVAGALAGAKTYIDNQIAAATAHLTGLATVNSQTSASKQTPPSDIQSKYMHSMFKAQLQNNPQPPQTGVDPSQSQLAAAFNANLGGSSTQALQSAIQGSGIVSTAMSPAGLFGGLLADLLQALQTMLDAGIDLIQKAVTATFSLLGEAVDAAFQAASTRFNIPYLTAFYENVVWANAPKQGPAQFSLLGLSSLLAAIPFTVAYKLVSGNSGPVFSAQEVQETGATGWLNSVYQTSWLNSLLGGQQQQPSDAPRNSGPVVSIRGEFQPTLFQKVSAGAGYVYAVATALWGVTCVIEDTIALSKPDVPEPATILDKLLYWAKISTQVVAFLAAFPVFTLGQGSPFAAGMLLCILWNCDFFQLCSNYCATPGSDYGAVVDPIITGAIGVLELGLGIAYGVVAGGNGLRIGMDIANNIYQSFEWIPQLLKTPILDPATRKVAAVLIPAMEGGAYFWVTMLTVGGTTYALETGN